MANANSTCINLSLSGVVCYGVFFNFEKDPVNEPLGVNCTGIDNFDPDVAGIGVVISFTASCLITTLASITAAILDYIAGTDQPLLPHRWQPKNVSASLREKCLFARRILDRLILDFADQQLVTGFALLISAWVKLHSNAALESLPPADQKTWLRFPNLALPNSEFSLITFLCMASSSSHLASILVLGEYMESHRSSARLRMGLMVIFAAFLAVTISLASSLTAYFAWVLVRIFSAAIDGKIPPVWVGVLVLALSIAVPLLIILEISWLCTLQLSPRLKGAVKRKVSSVFLARIRRWFRLSKIWHSGFMRLLPQRWRQPLTTAVKRVFWFIVLGNESIIFTVQIILAVLSMIWVGLQRLGTPPEYWSLLPSSDGSGVVPTRIPLCSLHKVAGKGEIASFGQLLPLIFLVLPLFSAYGSYIEESDRRHELGQKHSSAYTFIVDPDTPNVPRRPVRKQTRESLGEESELTLLSPRSRRHESDASGISTAYRPERTHTRTDSQGGVVGMGIRYDNGPSPPEHQYSIGSFGFQGTGSMGWPGGYGTGVEESYRSCNTNR